MNFEYGILIIKPDGNKYAIYEKVKQRILENNLDVVYEKKLKLSKQLVLEKFTSPFDMDIYSDYLSSDEVTAFLVKGKKTAYNLRKMKIDFRAEHGYTSKDMRNLVHSVDPGNEYYNQFPVFFPELNMIEYSFCADLTITLNCNNNEALNRLDYLDKVSNLEYIGIIDKYNNENDILEKFHKENRSIRTFLGLSKEFEFEGKNIQIIGYLPENIKKINNIPEYIKDGNIETFFNWIKLHKGICVLGYLPYHEHSTEYLKKLTKYGLDGVIVYDPRSTLYEAEELEDIVCDLNLACFGGSGTSNKWGELSIGYHEFSYCFKTLNNETV
ncbi:hypothetical protein PV797_14555 [Clostridiaceae bacterium M8S5]|nr:hypothetical protein PV797_14555 [Clostridiaceae bacterium M8S5]